jgi:hypothetical protein
MVVCWSMRVMHTLIWKGLKGSKYRRKNILNFSLLQTTTTHHPVGWVKKNFYIKLIIWAGEIIIRSMYSYSFTLVCRLVKNAWSTNHKSKIFHTNLVTVRSCKQVEKNIYTSSSHKHLRTKVVTFSYTFEKSNRKKLHRAY